MPDSRCQSTLSQISDDALANGLIISANSTVRLHILATDNTALITIATQLLEIAWWQWMRWQNNVVFHYTHIRS